MRASVAIFAQPGQIQVLLVIQKVEVIARNIQDFALKRESKVRGSRVPLINLRLNVLEFLEPVSRFAIGANRKLANFIDHVENHGNPCRHYAGAISSGSVGHDRLRYETLCRFAAAAKYQFIKIS
jgi:hypothetical protein